MSGIRCFRNHFQVGSLVFVLMISMMVAANDGASETSVNTSLNDGKTYSHWAHASKRAQIRRLPRSNSARVGRLHLYTQSGNPDIYLVLRRLVAASGQVWLQIRIPTRPNGRVGWVKEDSMGPLNRVLTRMVVDRRNLRATLYKSGKRVWRSPMGIGKPNTPTPRGHFWIREKFVLKQSNGVYGPRAFGTSSYSVLTDWPAGGVIGIHGTNQPSLIPGRPSHGCIRIPNRSIIKLYRLMPLGTPLDIR